VSGELVAAVTVAAILGYLAVALAVRHRSLRARGPSLRREGGPAAWLPYFLPVPYLVAALRPPPEIAVPEPARWAGLAVVVLGAAFSAWAALTLGRHFDVEVELHAGHEVVRRGPYAVVRHPVYSGLALHLLGACVATGNLVLLAGTLLVALPAFYLRAAVEERLLRDGLGPAYAAYAREVGMLVPFIGTGSR
jgi:protein-S-isoprenylcysteine O-methyltransferase Ste14